MNEPSDQPRDPTLSRLYQANARSEPAPRLDEAILAAAHRAARPAPARPAPKWLRLRAPLALAATVMLAVMLSLTVDRNPPRIEERVAPPAPAKAAPEAPMTGKAGGEAAKQAPPPAREARKPTAPAPAAKPQAAPAQPPAIRDEAPASAPATSALGGAAGPSTEADAARAAPAERSRNLATPAERADRKAKQEATAVTPEAWLDEIRALRRQGRQAEAERRLQEFRAAFPDYPLPDDLR